MTEPSDSDESRPTRTDGRSLFHTAAGVILIMGLVLAAALIGWTAVLFERHPDGGQSLLGIALANTFFGRAAGLSLGFTAPLPSGLVVFVNGLIETIQVLLTYPLIILGWRHLVRFRPLARYLAETRQSAEHCRPLIERYGPIGLFAFVWIPFWMTGPVVGAAIGFMLGLRHWVTLSVVLGGTWFAILCWAQLLGAVQDRMAQFGRFAPFGFVIALILVVLEARWLHRCAERRHPSKN